MFTRLSIYLRPKLFVAYKFMLVHNPHSDIRIVLMHLSL